MLPGCRTAAIRTAEKSRAVELKRMVRVYAGLANATTPAGDTLHGRRRRERPRLHAAWHRLHSAISGN
jgi:hypothetical protein